MFQALYLISPISGRPLSPHLIHYKLLLLSLKCHLLYKACLSQSREAHLSSVLNIPLSMEETTFDLTFSPCVLKSDCHIVTMLSVCLLNWVLPFIYLADKWLFLRYRFILTFPFSNPCSKSFLKVILEPHPIYTLLDFKYLKDKNILNDY